MSLGAEAWSFDINSTHPETAHRTTQVWNRPMDPNQKRVGQSQAFIVTWENPSQEVEVTTLDFSSALNSATPYLYSITAAP